MKRTLINQLGLLGIVSLLSYIVAVILSPLAYPGYNWLSQAVSDLSADNSPSLILWRQLSALYGPCGITCITLVCIYIQDKLSRSLRVGIYLFTVMQWVSAVGYTMFPLSDSGYANDFQGFMHGYVVTAAVVLLSIISLVLIIIGGYRKKQCVSLAVWATIALALMMAGGIGTGVAPKEIFGLFERFSVFAATGFNAVLGVYLFRGFPQVIKKYKNS
jgi:hypothetical membrane protein